MAIRMRSTSRGGNVFYRLRACEVQPRGHCESPPKIAFFVDDRAEITTRQLQTGKTLRELFALPPGTALLRDTEGPEDDPIALEKEIRFEDGPVFYSRAIYKGLIITVNSRVFGEHDGVKAHMTGREIASLVYPENPENTRIWEVSPEKREIDLNEVVSIKRCEAFDVVRRNVTGGFEGSRIERELEQLRAGGLKVTFVAGPVPAVVYHDLGSSLGGNPVSTDVLVAVPAAYPGQFIDYAFLPEGSPLIGKVVGSPQEPRISALGKSWQQISYHPHNGGGGPGVESGPPRLPHLRRRTPLMAPDLVTPRIILDRDGQRAIIRFRESDRRLLEQLVFSRYPRREWGTFFRFGFRRTSWGLALSYVDLMPPQAV